MKFSAAILSAILLGVTALGPAPTAALAQDGGAKAAGEKAAGIKSAGDKDASPAGAADRRNALLAEIALAKSKQIYLALDPATGEIQLKIQGVVLRAIPTRASLDSPRSRPAVWPGAVFTLQGGIPQYERPVIIPPNKGEASQEDSGGVSPDDLVANRNRALEGMPTVYLLTFTPDLSILVRGEPPAEGLGASWRRTWTAFKKNLANGWARLGGTVAPLTVVLDTSPEDARRLGLALQPDMGLVILAP